MSNVIDDLMAYEVVDSQGFRVNNTLPKILQLAREHLTSDAKRSLTWLLKRNVRVQRDGNVIVFARVYDEVQDFFAWNLWMLKDAVETYTAQVKEG